LVYFLYGEHKTPDSIAVITLADAEAFGGGELSYRLLVAKADSVAMVYLGFTNMVVTDE